MNTLWPQALVQNLGWTLIHFLWQGAALAALLWILLRVPGSSSRRYLAACFALLLMALAPIITFACLARQNQPAGASAAAEPAASLIKNIETTVTGSPVKITVPFKTSSRPPALSERLEGLLPWLVCGWLAGVMGFSARLGAGWLEVRKLGRIAAQPLGEPWITRVAELARRLGVNRSLRLLQSALVEVPTVIGWLRPVILLPAGCLTGLTPQQLESILAHELAHVRRHDYLVNVLQSVVETLLFYHPAVWWVSRRIREERENCCDDLAVKICGDRVAYARALATLEESRLAPAQCAVAAAGPPLLQRIRRVLGQSERAGGSGWLFAGIITVVTVTVLAIDFRDGQARETNQPNIGVAALVKDAQSLCEAGKLDEAEARLAQARQVDPQNPAVLDGMISIKNARSAAVLKEHRAVEQTASSLIAKLYPVPPLVNLQVKFAETDEGFDPGQTFGANGLLTSNFVASPSLFLSDVPAIFNYQLTNSISERFNGILTDPQFRVALHALEQRGKTDILTLPDVTTESGRGALIDTTEEVVLTNAVSGAVKTTMSFGPKVDLMAEVSSDQNNIELTTIATVSGLLDQPTAFRPRIQFSQMSSKTTLGDGQTLLLCGLESRLAGKDPKWLLVFVTPVIIYPDGSRIHPNAANSAAKIPTSSQTVAKVDRNPARVESVTPKLMPASALSENSQAVADSTAPSLFGPYIEDPSQSPPSAILTTSNGILATLPLPHFRLRQVTTSVGVETDRIGPPKSVSNDPAPQIDPGVKLVDQSPQPVASNSPPLVTRTYHVDPNTFRQGLETQGIFLTNAAANPLSNSVSDQVRQFFINRGVDLSTNSGRRLVYNDRKGELLAKATVADLKLVEQTISVVCAAPQVSLKVQFVEIDRANNATNRLDWLPAGVAATFISNTARKLSDPPPFSASPGESPFDPAKLPRSPTNSIITQFQGLLTGPQGQVIIHALQQREGVDVLATPSVVTESGRQAQIAVTQAHTVVTGLDSGRDAKGAVTNNYRTQNIQCGAVLDAIPRVLADGSIEVSVAGTVTEFLGYDEPRAPAFKKEAASGPANAQFPLPRFRVRQVATKATAQDGQTIVLGGFVGDSVATRTVSKVPVLGDLPLVGRLFKTTTVHQAKKDLIIFITPTIIQPDGSRVHPKPAPPPSK